MWVVQTCCGQGSPGNPLLSCPWWSVRDGWQSCCHVLMSTQNQHIQKWPVQTEVPSWRRCTQWRRAPEKMSPCQQEIEQSRGKWGLAGWTIMDHIPPGQLYWEHQISLVRVTPEYTEPSREERKEPSRIELESSSFSGNTDYLMVGTRLAFLVTACSYSNRWSVKCVLYKYNIYLYTIICHNE